MVTRQQAVQVTKGALVGCAIVAGGWLGTLGAGATEARPLCYEDEDRVEITHWNGDTDVYCIPVDNEAWVAITWVDR